MRSEKVKREWEYALSLRGSEFIRPTYWETPLPQSEAETLPPTGIEGSPLSTCATYQFTRHDGDYG